MTTTEEHTPATSRFSVGDLVMATPAEVDIIADPMDGLIGRVIEVGHTLGGQPAVRVAWPGQSIHGRIQEKLLMRPATEGKVADWFVVDLDGETPYGFQIPRPTGDPQVIRLRPWRPAAPAGYNGELEQLRERVKHLEVQRDEAVRQSNLDLELRRAAAARSDELARVEGTLADHGYQAFSTGRSTTAILVGGALAHLAHYRQETMRLIDKLDGVGNAVSTAIERGNDAAAAIRAIADAVRP